MVGPRGKSLQGEAVLLLRCPAGEEPGTHNLVVCELRDGEWLAVPSAEAPDGWVGGRIETGGQSNPLAERITGE